MMHYQYITLFCDMDKRNLLFATENKGSAEDRENFTSKQER